MRNIRFFISLFLLCIKLFGQSNASPSKEVYISKIPKPTKPAYLVVSGISFSDKQGNNNQLLDANENADIIFTLSNKGQGDAFGLLATITENNQIKGLEYTKKKSYGDLKAGKDMNITLPLSGRMDIESGKAEFEILITEGNNFDADAFKVFFNTQKFKNPALIISDHKFTTNSEGKIKLGHPVSLNLIVQNVGQGEASEVKVNFINPPNVFPGNETFFEVERLKPNESKNIVYEFFANKKYNGNDIPIQVSITEGYGKYGQNKTLSVSLEERLSKTKLVNVDAIYEKDVEIDRVSLSSDVDKDIPEKGGTNENCFALIIGNEDYSSFQQSISSEMNVAFATNDALTFREYCHKTIGVPNQNIIYLTNATTGKMLQAIDKINKLIQATDGKASVVVYYAGHGLPDENTKEPYLIPVDVSGSNIQSAIKLSYLYEKLTQFPAVQVSVFLDACFSGGGRESGLLAARGVKIKPKNEYLKGNIVVFTASSGEESSLPWKEKQHGMFTYYLLKKLQETKGSATFGELSAYLTDKVRLESVRVNSKSQNPQVLISEEMKTTWENRQLE